MTFFNCLRWVTGGITDNDRVLKTTEIRFLNGSWGAGPNLQNPVFCSLTYLYYSGSHLM